MNLSDDEKVIEFFLERELNYRTENHYIRNLNYYIKAAGDGLTPTTLINEAKREEMEGIYEDNRKIKKRFLNFKRWLKDNHNMDATTKRFVFNSIKTFYKTLNIKWIPDTTIKVKRKKQVKFEQLPNQEEIKKAILASNIQYQAIILLGVSSGLHNGDIRELKYSDFLKSFNQQSEIHFNDNCIDDFIQMADEKEIVLKWEGYRFKNNIEYLTFSSPEATRAILEYIRIDPPLGPDDFLFRTKGKQILDNTFKAYFTDLNDRLGLQGIARDEIKKYKRINLRNFRSRFASILMSSELGYRQIEYMLGHILQSTQDSYYKLLPEEVMRRSYLKALPNLMIFEPIETRVLTDEKLEEYEKRDRQREAERELERREREAEKHEKEELKKIVMETRDDIKTIARDPEAWEAFRRKVQKEY